MNCLEFRRLVGAEPARESDELLAHRSTCQACSDYARQMQALDARLRRALLVSVPQAVMDISVDRPASDRPARRAGGAGARRWLALAASILITAGLGFGIWLSFPTATLATAVVDHMQHESHSMVTTAERIAPFDLESVLRASGVRMAHPISSVSYARSCRFRGDLVPHLVVQTDGGPVTVMLLRNEHVAGPVDFEDQGYAGTFVPSGKGSIAVLGAPGVGIAQVADRVERAVEWIE